MRGRLLLPPQRGAEGFPSGLNHRGHEGCKRAVERHQEAEPGHGVTLRCSSMVRFWAKSSGQSGHLKTLTRWLSKCWSKWEESRGLWVKTVSHIAHL